MDLTLVPYQQQDEKYNNTNETIKYKECMRNHAASIGGHANDGCGEFMPRADSTGTCSDSLICAACGCHRNFHRRETAGGGDSPPFHHHHLMHQPPLPMLLYKSYHQNGGGGGMTAVDVSRSDYDRRSETPEREEVNLNVGPGSSGASSGKVKRHRTKFTQEQKERMLEFAERTGWRMNRQDDVALNRFCAEVGITRNVLKVWMHNNKNAHRRRDEPAAQLPVVAAPPPPQPVGV